jgi:hypothetical protein
MVPSCQTSLADIDHSRVSYVSVRQALGGEGAFVGPVEDVRDNYCRQALERFHEWRVQMALGCGRAVVGW